MSEEYEKAIDNELISTHLGSIDSFDSAKDALDAIINWHVEVATDPKVNGGKVTISEAEYERLKRIDTILTHSLPQKTGAYFICGEAGEADNMGLPQHIFVCPSMGLDGMAMYTLSKPYSAPGY